jgi:hypothetical protein
MKAAKETETQYALPFKIPAEFVHDNGDVRELGLDPILRSVLTDQQTPTQMLETFAYFLQITYGGCYSRTEEVPEQIQDFACEVYLHRAPLSDCLAPTFTRRPDMFRGQGTLLMEFMKFLDHDVLEPESAQELVDRFLDEREAGK